MRMQFPVHADPGERFAESAFASQVGRTVSLNILGQSTPVTVLAAEVQDGGAVAMLTIDIPDEPEEPQP